MPVVAISGFRNSSAFASGNKGESALEPAKRTLFSVDEGVPAPVGGLRWSHGTLSFNRCCTSRCVGRTQGVRSGGPRTPTNPVASGRHASPPGGSHGRFGNRSQHGNADV